MRNVEDWPSRAIRNSALVLSTELAAGLPNAQNTSPVYLRSDSRVETVRTRPSRPLPSFPFLISATAPTLLTLCLLRLLLALLLLRRLLAPRPATSAPATTRPRSSTPGTRRRRFELGHDPGQSLALQHDDFLQPAVLATQFRRLPLQFLDSPGQVSDRALEVQSPLLLLDSEPRCVKSNSRQKIARVNTTEISAGSTKQPVRPPFPPIAHSKEGPVFRIVKRGIDRV